MGSRTTHINHGVAVTSVRIEREKLSALKRVAGANRRSVSQEIRWLIDRHIEDSARKAAA